MMTNTTVEALRKHDAALTTLMTLLRVDGGLTAEAVEGLKRCPTEHNSLLSALVAGDMAIGEFAAWMKAFESRAQTGADAWERDLLDLEMAGEHSRMEKRWLWPSYVERALRWNAYVDSATVSPVPRSVVDISCRLELFLNAYMIPVPVGVSVSSLMEWFRDPREMLSLKFREGATSEDIHGFEDQITPGWMPIVLDTGSSELQGQGLEFRDATLAELLLVLVLEARSVVQSRFIARSQPVMLPKGEPASCSYVMRKLLPQRQAVFTVLGIWLVNSYGGGEAVKAPPCRHHVITGVK